MTRPKSTHPWATTLTSEPVTAEFEDREVVEVSQSCRERPCVGSRVQGAGLFSVFPTVPILERGHQRSRHRDKLAVKVPDKSQTYRRSC